MPSEVRRWWNDERIRWYEDAAALTDFHERLAEELSGLIPEKSTIAEAGCGLGHLSERLYRRGYSIMAYDSDRTVIERARKRTGLMIYEERDCYALRESYDYFIALFFGRITEGDNLKKLMRPAGKSLIYITGDGSGKRSSSTLTEDFLIRSGKHFSKRSLDLEFSQPLRDREDAENFLKSYYDGPVLEEKSRNLKPYGLSGYSYRLENIKKLTIYIINKE